MLDHSAGYDAHILNGVVDAAPGMPSFIEDNKTLESWLLRSAGGALHADVA